MERRYQVFVSSTYADLQEERRNVIQTLMEMDCIPSGMEIFPAIDEEQWEFIKKVISDCDYYILIIGGRYGSLTPEGISYTEKEYDFAIVTGLKVLAFLHKNPDDLSVKKSDIDPELRKKLNAFRDRVSRGRLVKYWTDPKELCGLVALSLSKTITTYPAKGWVRSDQVANVEILTEVNSLRKQNHELETKIVQLQNQISPALIADLAELSETIEVKGYYYWTKNESKEWTLTISWGELFSLIAPYLLQRPNDYVTKEKLEVSLTDKFESTKRHYINDQIYQTIKIQFVALGLVKIELLNTTTGSVALFWELTQKGKEMLLQSRSIKTNSSSINSP